MTQRLLVDTGPLVALLSVRDPMHPVAARTAAKAREPLATCWPVVTEAAWLLQRAGLPLDPLFDALRTAAIVLEPLGDDDVASIQGLIKTYRNLRLQLADACLLHLADRLDTDYVFTFDRRDFGAARTPMGRFLTIVPSDL